MNRLIKENYIPLKASDLGENHKLVLILTPGQGLIRIAVFGVKGKKSGSQRALIQPFSLCRGDLYYDPVKKLWRLKEGECLESRDSFHAHLNKYYAALFWSDLIIQTYAGGGSRDFFNLSESLFRDLDQEAEALVPGLFLSSLWDYLALEGIQPETNRCSRCGRPAPANKAVCYSPEGMVVCSRCRIDRLPLLTAPAREFLESVIGKQGLPEVDADTLESLTSYIMTILRTIVRLNMGQESLRIIFK
ncbi:DNA repair protein RecO [Oceanispirochaeta crateris]|uniref:DNA repair protein RecO n=1 Tax=Oceanispirochaeta crateris TaxID=2518645 RepID=A0A5C1QP84_9SPIO|nr:DNA repair protein RecO [Oceanispirochaeta crateris]QEN09783.1 DNA repair protein RecO [Oceanispirochaeta crateris]